MKKLISKRHNRALNTTKASCVIFLNLVNSWIHYLPLFRDLLFPVKVNESFRTWKWTEINLVALEDITGDLL